MKQFAAEDIWRDLSMREYDVLYTLSKCRAPIRISELNRHVLLSQPALSHGRPAGRARPDQARGDPATGAAAACRSPTPVGPKQRVGRRARSMSPAR